MINVERISAQKKPMESNRSGMKRRIWRIRRLFSAVPNQIEGKFENRIPVPKLVFKRNIHAEIRKNAVTGPPPYGVNNL
jgi:hypothetical protein